MFLRLTVTSDENLACTRFVFLARVGCMTGCFVRMFADLLWLATWLMALFAVCVLALPRSMAGPPAKVRSALELLTTDLAAANILKPALLMLQHLLATHAAAFYKERAFGAAFIVLVTIVLDLRMTADLGTLTLKAAWRWLSATR